VYQQSFDEHWPVSIEFFQLGSCGPARIVRGRLVNPNASIMLILIKVRINVDYIVFYRLLRVVVRVVSIGPGDVSGFFGCLWLLIVATFA